MREAYQSTGGKDMTLELSRNSVCDQAACSDTVSKIPHGC